MAAEALGMKTEGKEAQESNADITEYRSQLMMLLYISTGRPELHFPMCMLGKGNPLFKTRSEALKINNIIQFAKQTGDFGIFYPKHHGPVAPWRL